MQVIATAGHVDHGKSTLVRALTGMEPDRFAEEQRRGMTIELGYAWTDLPSGETVAFVDVPGHQRFVSTMLAGVGPVPAVLLVVAADEGWSAQSGEHLDALVALQVRHGVLAVTRADLGDAATAEAEARSYLDGTPLAGIEAVAVSAVTGEGLDDLRAALGRLARSLEQESRSVEMEHRSRLWVDRVFSIRGSGTVVTGTLGSGRVAVGDELELHPSGLRVAVRGVETLKRSVPAAGAVARVALNLRGVRAGTIRRGDALGGVGEWVDVDELDVRVCALRPHPGSRDVPAGGGRLPAELTVHVGSAAVAARVRPLGSDTVRLRLARPLPLSIGERCVLRDPGTRTVLAGALVLDPWPPGLHRRGAARARADELASLTGRPDLVEEVHRRGAVQRVRLAAIGVDGAVDRTPAGITAVGGWLVDDAVLARWRAQLVRAVDEQAARSPMHPGLPRPAAIRQLGVPAAEVFDLVLATTPGVVHDAAGVHRTGLVATLSPDAELALERLTARLGTDPFAAPEAAELSDTGLSPAVLGVAVHAGRLARVGPGVYLLPDALDEATRRLRVLEQPFTLTQARSALGTTRRVAVPLLEALDRAGRTRRLDSQLRAVV